MNIVRFVLDQAERRGSLVGLALAWVVFLPAAGFAQDATPAPNPTEGADAAAGDETEEGAENTAPEAVDPRTEAAVEEARRLRIERQTEITSSLPTEGGLLSSSLAIPEGLVGDRGLRYGRFILLPAAGFAAAYTDNSGADDTDRDDEVSLSAVGVVRAQSLLARHSVGVDATVSSSHSFQQSNDDYLDWQVGADGRLDFTRKSSVLGEVDYSRDTEDDSSVDADGQANDIETINGSAGYELAGNRIGYLVDFGVTRENFSGVGSADRDNSTFSVSQRISHNTTERLTLFAAPQYAYTVFDQEVADDGEARDVHSATALIGADMVFRSPFVLSAAVGYSRLFFEGSGTDDTDSLVANGTLGWKVSASSNVELSASHVLALTTVDDASARADTALELAATHQIGYNTLFLGELGGTYSDFNDLDRTDYDLRAGLGFTRRLTDHFFVSLAYQFQKRLSDDSDAEFYENQALLGFSVVY